MLTLLNYSHNPIEMKTRLLLLRSGGFVFVLFLLGLYSCDPLPSVLKNIWAQGAFTEEFNPDGTGPYADSFQVSRDDIFGLAVDDLPDGSELLDIETISVANAFVPGSGHNANNLDLTLTVDTDDGPVFMEGNADLTTTDGVTYFETDFLNSQLVRDKAVSLIDGLTSEPISVFVTVDPESPDQTIRGTLTVTLLFNSRFEACVDLPLGVEDVECND